MSSDHCVNASSGEIVHTNFLSEDIGALYLRDDYSDITLIVNDQRFHAHKVILAARSHYFRALLFGGLKESNQTDIEIKEPTLPAFKGLLKYVYTGFLSLVNQEDEVILEILGLSHKYGFTELETAISDYLKKVLQIRNVCMIFDAACLYHLEFLMKVCYEFLDKHALEIMQHESFLQLSSMALKDLLGRNSFYAEEIDIFSIVQSWIKANPSTETNEILSQVRLSLVSVSDLLTVVRPSGLVSPEVILDAIAASTMNSSSKLNHRGLLLVNENVATSEHGAEVLIGEMKNYLLDGDTDNYDMERGYTRHTISECADHCIIIKLGTQCIINHIKMLLWDKDCRSYSYYIEVSVNKKDWIKVIDYTQYSCRSWQYLYFEPRVILYIRIVGTNNTVNKVFHLVSFEAYFKNHSFRSLNGIIVPTLNVATTELSACVTEGVSRFRNTLLNGDFQNYDWDRGYTCHQLNSGCIQIQLGQPYMIDSLRLLLWDCDDRSYGYYVQVSTNSKNWELVVDKTKDSCRSWQCLHFSPLRPVVFIKIVGTHNTANEVFHCVHFECPAQANDFKFQSLNTSKEKLNNENYEQLMPLRPSSASSQITTEEINTQNNNTRYDTLEN